MQDYIKPEQSVTVHGLFLERVKRSPDTLAYRYFDTHQQAWCDLSWAQMRDQVARWQTALIKEKLQVGDRVAIMLRSCPQWVMYDQAALSLGLVLVPLYVVDRPDNVAYILKDSGAKVLLFETAEQWGELVTVKDQLDGVQRFISLEQIDDASEPRLTYAEAWLPAQAKMGYERVRDKGALATIMYTSGTTGKPKGVMLSHDNLVSNAYYSIITFSGGVTSEDIALSFLPLSHAFERTAGYYMMMTAGAAVAYARSVSLLADDLKIIRPTLMTAVPRIFERIYTAIHEKLEHGPALRRKLFALAVDVGWDRFEHQQGRGAWSPKLLLWPLLKPLVADKIMDRLGGRLRLTISGGAALPPKVGRLFIALGLRLIQGYGMTETSPVVCVNRIEDNIPSTIGPPLQGIEVRIGEQNALLVRGHCNMLGYWHNPAATHAMIDAEGWLNTGDTASIGPRGHVTITGRLKEIIVMSNGEKVPPADMEEAILHDRLFDQVMVYGEGKPTLIVLAVVNPERWKAFAKQVGVNADMPEALTDTRVERAVLDRIAERIKEFPGYAKVRRVLLLTEPWSIENGLVTPTLKLKRPQVSLRYSSQIEAVYKSNLATTATWPVNPNL